MTDEQVKELIQAITSVAISIDDVATELQTVSNLLETQNFILKQRKEN